MECFHIEKRATQKINQPLSLIVCLWMIQLFLLFECSQVGTWTEECSHSTDPGMDNVTDFDENEYTINSVKVGQYSQSSKN